jgi:hypothetical protein
VYVNGVAVQASGWMSVCPTQKQVHRMKGSEVDGAMETEGAPTEGCVVCLVLVRVRV